MCLIFHTKKLLKCKKGSGQTKIDLGVRVKKVKEPTAKTNLATRYLQL